MQIWRGPVWYLLAFFFHGRFLGSLFNVFYEFSDIFGVPLGACLETILVFFSCLSTWGAQEVFGGAKVTFGTVWRSFWKVLESFGIPFNNSEYL